MSAGAGEPRGGQAGGTAARVPRGAQGGPGRVVVRCGRVSVPVRLRSVLVGLLTATLLAAVALYSLTLGDYPLTPGEALSALVDPCADPLARYLLLELRPPRLVAALVAGTALGVAGALSQTVTGNPLGSPDVLGFTTGAATGAVLALVVAGGDLSTAGPAAALGALVTLGIVVAASRRAEDGLPMDRLVLVGIGVGAGLAGLNRFLIARAPVQNAAVAAQWEAGSIDGVLWPRVLGPAIACLVLLALCPVVARGLQVVGLGDDAALALGGDPRRTRVASIVLSVLLVAAATAVAGPLAFVAMAAPHATRLLAGTDRPGLVLSGLGGAAVVVTADVLGRTVLPGGQVPVGLVTGVVGGVYLVVLLARTWKRGEP